MRIALFLFIVGVAVTMAEDYTGYRVYRIYADNREQFDQMVENISSPSPIAVVWNISTEGLYADIMILPYVQDYEKYLETLKVRYDVLVDDLQKKLDCKC